MRNYPLPIAVRARLADWQALLDRRPGLAAGLAVATVLAIGLLDYWTGYELSFAQFYLAPVALAAWQVGAVTGRAVAALSATAWLVADLAAGHAYSQAWIPAWNSVFRLAMFWLLADLLTSLRRILLSEQELADSDPLTGLLNRRAFIELLESELARCRRYGEVFTIAYFDLDNFKQVNDRLGHAAGDELLCTVAETMREHIRETDRAARLGGDEFAALFPMTGREPAALGLAMLRTRLLDAMRAQGWPVTFSIGVLTCTRPLPVRDCIGTVDSLMYRVKNRNKDDLLHEEI